MEEIKLSICIPIYNRAKELNNLLENLLIEAENEKIQIVISDNASQDEIEEVILKYKNVFKNFKYIKNEKNMGFDTNLDKVINYSDGEYIWLMGSDDLITENAIAELQNEIKNKKFDIYILNGKVKMRNEIINRNGLRINQNKEYLNLNENLEMYINDIKNDISLFFAFISSLVIKREKYLENTIPIELKNSIYDHVYKILKMTEKNIDLKYLHNCFYIAGDNKNDWNNIVGKHFFIDISAMGRFISNIYKGEKERKMKKVLGKLFERNSKGLKQVLNIYYAKENNLIDDLEKYLKYFGLYNFKYKFFKIFLANDIVYFLLIKGIKVRNILFYN